MSEFSNLLQTTKVVLPAAVGIFLMIGPSAAQERPNIVFILSDDHTWRDAGAFGNADVHTPNLDRLAAGGMRFDVKLPDYGPRKEEEKQR